MPIIKSAKKRSRVSRKAAIRNSKTKRSLKEAIKAFHVSLTTGGKKSVELQSKAQSAIDKAGKKNVMHKNKVARKQRQLAAAAKKAGLKPSASSKAAKKTATKASAKTKPSVKKTATKKTPSPKKPSAKK